MASSYDAKIQDAWKAVEDRTAPGTARLVAMGAMAWGAAALAYGTFAGDKAWTLGGCIVAIVYGVAITQGAVMYGVVMSGTQARWGRPLNRIAQAVGLAFPFVYLFYLAFLLLGLNVYPWSPDTLTGVIEHDAFTGTPIALAPHALTAPDAKGLWLSKGFFMARHAVAFGFLALIDLLFIRATLRADMIEAKTRLKGAVPGWWSWFIGGETDARAAAEKGAKTQESMVPLMAMSYALIMSMMAFDLIMSLDPWWFSNMFGGWIFMSSFWLALTFIGAYAAVSRDWLKLGAWVKPSTMHDLGKLTLAGCMFWAYTLYAQLLPYYYTNVPEETNFLLVRLMLPQWNPLARAVAVTCFLAPFTILLSRGIKKMRWPFFGLNALVMFGLFLERSLLVLPSVHAGATVPWGTFLFVNLGLVAGMIGMIVLVSSAILTRLPAVPVCDPFLEDHPWDVHVHGLDGHGHAHH